MVPSSWNSNLLFVALILLIVALIYLIIMLYRANRAVSRLDHISQTATDLVEKLLPALLNIGTVTTAVQALIKTLSDHKTSSSKKKS